jgi:uncharacterized protein YeaO (DUF488 family)
VTLKIYTAQYAYKGDDRSDTSVETSDRSFAQTWSLVTGHESGQISDEEHVKKYKHLMRKSYVERKHEWLEVLSRDQVTSVCSCKSGASCHESVTENKT